MVFVAEVATHFYCYFHLKVVEDTCGSPGMLENRPTHEILQMTVCKYRPVAFPAGVATHFYWFLPKIVQLFPNIKTDTFYCFIFSQKVEIVA